MKFFTIRSDGTINVDGVLLNVYKTERSNLVLLDGRMLSLMAMKL